MIYGHWTGYNLLPSDADGKIRPDIISMMRQVKGKFIYSKPVLPQLQILLF